MTKYVFVYGTLKYGYNNHIHISPMVEFVDSAILNNHKLYYSSGQNSYPVMCKTPYNKVLGELYKVSNLSVFDIMDEIEGEGFLYNRTEVKTFTTDMKMYNAYTYVGNPSTWDFDTMDEVTNKKISEWR